MWAMASCAPIRSPAIAESSTRRRRNPGQCGHAAPARPQPVAAMPRSAREQTPYIVVPRHQHTWSSSGGRPRGTSSTRTKYGRPHRTRAASVTARAAAAAGDRSGDGISAFLRACTHATPIDARASAMRRTHLASMLEKTKQQLNGRLALNHHPNRQCLQASIGSSRSNDDDDNNNNHGHTWA